MALELSANARRALEARYLRRDATGKIRETPDELCAPGAGRGARRTPRRHRHPGCTVGGALLSPPRQFRLPPQLPDVNERGDIIEQLPTCFVLPAEDSMKAIVGTLRDMALVQRTGSGTGFSFGHPRLPSATPYRQDGSLGAGLSLGAPDAPLGSSRHRPGAQRWSRPS